MNKQPLIPKERKLDKNLPAPSWSPTGDSGYWVWRNEKWGWLTDEEYEELKMYEANEERQTKLNTNLVAYWILGITTNTVKRQRGWARPTTMGRYVAKAN